MSTPFEHVQTQALQLSATERAALADRLWMSLDEATETDAAWEAEILHRTEQIQRGDVVCRPWDDVMTELRAKYG
jgi:putative addiction module component (TIGR02574 family)